MRVLVFGAGVIGSVYAALLTDSGHDVVVHARGARARVIEELGIRLCADGVARSPARPRVQERVDAASRFDLALVAIRRDQVEGALPEIARLNAEAVATLVNLPLGTSAVADAVGRDRFVGAFPGVGGRLEDSGSVRYLAIKQQPTVIGDGAAATRVVGAIRSTGLPAARTNDIDAWLAAHAIFIAAFESALAAVRGDVEEFAARSRAVRELVLAVRQGYHALQALGRPVVPPAMKTIFCRVPLGIATRYWRRQLTSDLGRLALAPHAVAARHTELPAMQRDVQTLLGGVLPVELERVFETAR